MEKWILYEDNHIIVVNKPPRILVQGDKTGDTTLLDLTKKYIKKLFWSCIFRVKCENGSNSPRKQRKSPTYPKNQPKTVKNYDVQSPNYSRPWKVIHGDGIGGRGRTLKDAIGKSHRRQWVISHRKQPAFPATRSAPTRR